MNWTQVCLKNHSLEGANKVLEMMKQLQGKTAVITGGSGVLCRAMAEELSRHGVKIAILNRNEAKGTAVAEKINKSGGKAIAISCDVLDVESVKAAEQKVNEAYGPCDI